MQSRFTDSMTSAGRSERKVALLTKECDGLKRIIAAYKNDEGAPTRHNVSPSLIILVPKSGPRFWS